MKCTLTDGYVIAAQVEQAATFWSRLKGLMFHANLPTKNALLLEPCPQIHTCFMRFNIDVIFLDAQNCVVEVVENLKPWRMSKFYAKARRALELPGGSLQGCVRKGDQLIFN